MCVCCRKGLEKDWDLEQVLTKAFLQVDAALASEAYSDGMNISWYENAFHSHAVLLKNFQAKK